MPFIYIFVTCDVLRMTWGVPMAYVHIYKHCRDEVRLFNVVVSTDSIDQISFLCTCTGNAFLLNLLLQYGNCQLLQLKEKHKFQSLSDKKIYWTIHSNLGKRMTHEMQMNTLKKTMHRKETCLSQAPEQIIALFFRHITKIKLTKIKL